MRHQRLTVPDIRGTANYLQLCLAARGIKSRIIRHTRVFWTLAVSDGSTIELHAR